LRSRPHQGARKTHTIILSSHILSEVSAICDYVMIISKGKLVASDTPEKPVQKMAGSNTLQLTAAGTRPLCAAL
jgi:ABC-2 type transport system ATP-binding protein